MSPLHSLRTRLKSLRLARAAVRWGCALLVLVLALLLGWVLAYALDRSFNLSWFSRAVILAAWCAGVGWLIWRRVAPAMMTVESLEELALQVERRQQIDSDLIAALQFDAMPAGAWGSPRLSVAVVESVADFSRSLNVFEGFTWRPLLKQAAAAFVATALAGAACAAFPAEAAAFWNRFWLGTAHYPTRTVISCLQVNGEPVPVYHTTSVRLRLPQGQPLRVEAETTGEPAVTGTVLVRGTRSRTQGTWPLTFASDRWRLAPQSLVEDVRLRVRLGDATSDPIDIAVVSLPVVELRWTVTPPAYAPPGSSEAVPEGARQFSVLAGSRVSLSLECVNKRLQSAAIELPSGSTALVPQPQGERTVWTVPAGTELDKVADQVTYQLVALDEDGLSPDPRVVGQIRLKPDRPPRVAAAVLSRRVLPAARPRISYGAIDDFGVSRVLLAVDVVPVEGEPRHDERVIWSRPDGARGESAVRGETALDLSPYRLAKGDQVRIAIVAEDDRGAAPPQRGQSEPLTLDVTDRNGILAGLLETDQQSAQQLDAIILRELGIGGGRK